jgi:NADH:ubiquinone oxidoreductase subunit 2 (subunit N)
MTYLGSIALSLSLIIVAILSINQSKLTRILVFSGIFYTALIYISQVTSLWYTVVLIYSLHMGAIFAVTKIFSLRSIFSLGNISFTNKFYGLSVVTTILSMIGIPPLSGFIGKIIPISSLMSQN